MVDFLACVVRTDGSANNAGGRREDSDSRIRISLFVAFPHLPPLLAPFSLCYGVLLLFFAHYTYDRCTTPSMSHTALNHDGESECSVPCRIIASPTSVHSAFPGALRCALHRSRP